MIYSVISCFTLLFYTYSIERKERRTRERAKERERKSDRRVARARSCDNIDNAVDETHARVRASAHEKSIYAMCIYLYIYMITTCSTNLTK